MFVDLCIVGFKRRLFIEVEGKILPENRKLCFAFRASGRDPLGIVEGDLHRKIPVNHRIYAALGVAGADGFIDAGAESADERFSLEDDVAGLEHRGPADGFDGGDHPVLGGDHVVDARCVVERRRCTALDDVDVSVVSLDVDRNGRDFVKGKDKIQLGFAHVEGRNERTHPQRVFVKRLQDTSCLDVRVAGDLDFPDHERGHDDDDESDEAAEHQSEPVPVFIDDEGDAYRPLHRQRDFRVRGGQTDPFHCKQGAAQAQSAFAMLRTPEQKPLFRQQIQQSDGIGFGNLQYVKAENSMNELIHVRCTSRR